MRMLAIAVIAATAIMSSWPSTEAAAAPGQQARSLGECVRLANARGWNRRGEKGRWPFIKACMAGRAG